MKQVVKVKMLKSENGQDVDSKGIAYPVRTYKVGEVYSMGASLARSLVSMEACEVIEAPEVVESPKNKMANPKTQKKVLKKKKKKKGLLS